METRGPYLLTEKLVELEKGWIGKANLQSDPESPPVLLKILPEEPPERWQLSIDLLQGTRCRHIRIPTAVSTDAKGSYLVARWLDGPNLEDARRNRFKGKVPARQALVWLKHLLLALEVLHVHGLVHGDVKPSNLVLNKKDEAVLTDLGAMFPASCEQYKSATPEYLTPDENHHASVQRDLYAAALTFGALVSGSIPPSPGEEPYLLSELDPLIPKVTDSILTRVQGFGEQYNTATEMLAEVEILLGEREREPEDTSPPTRVVEVKKSKNPPTVVPILIALLCFPFGIAAGHIFKPPPPGKPYTLVERTGLDIRQGSYEGRDVWQVTILGRPVMGFAGKDATAGDETPEARAHWVQAVLTEAQLEDRRLTFEYRRELVDNCEVWLVGEGLEEKFLFRVTKREHKLFDTPAPVLARLWSRLIQDTLTLLGADNSPGKSAGVLLLRPWASRADTMSGGKNLGEAKRVEVLEQAFISLKPDLKEKILSSYTPEEEET